MGSNRLQHCRISWMKPSADIISLMATKITAQSAQLWHSAALHWRGRLAQGCNGPVYFQPGFFLSLSAQSTSPISSISTKELRREMGRVEQFRSAVSTLPQPQRTPLNGEIKWCQLFSKLRLMLTSSPHCCGPKGSCCLTERDAGGALLLLSLHTPKRILTLRLF